ncbi:MAG TPA: DUF4287 domain-containing protein [Xanthobacteraceae bacterium]|jgi:hypothetical protein
MSFQAYIDNVKAKTGKVPEDFARLARKKGLSKHGELVKWLKTDFELGHGHATAIAGVLLRAGAPKTSPEQKLQALVAGTKEHWRKPIDKLIAHVAKFGPDVTVAVGGTYISLLRRKKKFGILQPSSAERLDVGVKLKGASASGRFETAGSWNTMITHRVRIADPKKMDSELLSWLKAAYETA